MTNNTTYRTLASGSIAAVVGGKVVAIYRDQEQLEYDEGAYYDIGNTCLICDGLGHGYPGAGPCPLEDAGWDILEEERERLGR